MDAFTSWASRNRKIVLAIAGVLTAAIVLLLGWLTFSQKPTGDDPSSKPVESTLEAPATPESEEGESLVVDPGPDELPEVDLAPQVDTWQVSKLEPIPSTSDPVEFAEHFAQVWMAPNYSAYSKEAFTEWVFDHYSPNDLSARLTNDAQVSIHDQMLPADQWDTLAADGHSQAVRLLSVEEPAWADSEVNARSFLKESAANGWANTTLVEAYGIVYTTGLLDGKARFEHVDLNRNLYAIKCEPYCGVADVLTNDVHRLGGDRHTKTFEDFDESGGEA